MSITAARPRASGPRRRKRRTLTFLVLLGVTAFALYRWWKHREEEHARLRSETPEPWAPRMDLPVEPVVTPAEPRPVEPEPASDECSEPAPFFERTAEIANGSTAPVREATVARAAVEDEQRASAPAPLTTNEAAAPLSAATESDGSDVFAAAHPLGLASIAHSTCVCQQPSVGGSLPNHSFAPPSSRAPLPRAGSSKPPLIS
jgi:hypothetical protein